MEDLLQKLEDLKEALKAGSISVNEYSTMYFNTYQKLKQIKNTIQNETVTR